MPVLKSAIRRRVLVVDDEPMVTDWLKMVVEQADSSPGYEVRAAAVGSRAIELFRTWRPDVVLIDIVLPDIDGIALLRQLKAIDPVPEMIVISGVGTITRALEAGQAGAFYFLEKSNLDPAGLLSILDRATSLQVERVQHERLKEQMRGQYAFANIIGRSKNMRELFELVDAVAESDANILIQGENGVGKELIANAIHVRSGRSTGPFIKINCAALPKDLIESELFGYKKGAFTGATTDKVGLLELAGGGSLMLDEIGEMPILLQTKLLRVLQEREFRPIGSDRLVKVDFRLICATNIDSEAAMRADRGPAAVVFAFSGEVQQPLPEERQEHFPGGVSLADSLSLAGQRPRTRECDRTRGAGGQAGGCAAIGLARADPRRLGRRGRVHGAAAPHARRDRTDDRVANTAANQLEQAGGRPDSGLVPADAV
jgi:DNA-binding NtrC family response regulator